MELVAGMKYVHAQNIVHRDLNPSNLVFDLNFQLYICDFGSSKKLFLHEGARRRIGTSAYMAPEMYHDCQYGHQIDVWAFGCILYEIVTTGEPLFSGTQSQHCPSDWHPVIPPTVLPWVAELIQNCLQPDPSRRPDFGTIEKTLQQNDFAILPEVDLDSLRARFETIQRIVAYRVARLS
jgi:serine/threonine-protein kinase CTR1